jgi:LmbE family N-acetylglucosaminyl deacetylase
MKISIFEPHPDDECFGAGGSIMIWLNEGKIILMFMILKNEILIK